MEEKTTIKSVVNKICLTALAITGIVVAERVWGDLRCERRHNARLNARKEDKKITLEVKAPEGECKNC